ncbi:MAG TPA: hypothetical protein VMT53_26850 [Terriglobales bacterium]|nr:hypothetical protein [Terriglobales bacterium]
MTRTRPKRVVLLYLLALLAVLACVGLFIHGVRRVRVQDVQAAIAQGLAPGSDEPTIRRFMDAHHILYAGYSQELRRSYGKIYRTSFVGLSKGRILVQFDFDEQGRMVSSRVVEVYDFIWE